MATNHIYLKKLAEDVGLPSDIVFHPGAEFPELPGAKSIGSWHIVAGPGIKLFEIMETNVKKRKNIRVEFSSPAKRIIQGDNREVLGILAERNGKQIAVRGKRATILSCGGYEYNEQLKLNNLFGKPRYFYGTDSNTGDGVYMSMAAGAELWHMNWASQHYGFHYKGFPVGMTAFNAFTQAMSDKPWSFMIVDQYGKRFFNESDHGHSSYLYLCYFDPAKGVYPRLPSYVIFDETLRTAGEPLSTNEMPIRDDVRPGPFAAKVRKYKYYWSKDQSAEIEKGWIMKADTLDELAKKINERQGPNPIQDYPSNVKMDPAVLKASIETYNKYAQQGHDPEFGRKKFLAVEKPPFYATEVWAVGPNTQGGPKFNTKLQVVDPYGNPIPRLYKAGELGSIYGERYPNGGGNIAEILGFGRIAGQNAAREKPQA
jgi:succinate dehydrogenase/fumarate reductase flavoprotein subunit